MTKLSKSRIANTLNIKVYRCEILFIREEILSVGLPPVRFFDVVVIQYFSLLFKRESGWNPEQCPLL